MNKIKNELVH